LKNLEKHLKMGFRKILKLRVDIFSEFLGFSPKSCVADEFAAAGSKEIGVANMFPGIRGFCT
jgi:hypothetical protein